ncbi:MAG: carbohydrate binding domain-containing protein [Candidatus Nomurabacteria bacterium]|nr:MAG: carbohydrate binding domain-containing protein [Candidatus Nomurabacteria bacterium]
MILPSEQSKKKKSVRAIASFLLPMVLLVTVLGVALPRESKAQIGAVGSLAGFIWKEVKDSARYIATQAKAAFEKAQDTSYAIAFKNSLRVFLGKVAEDTAVWVSSAGTGQKPLFITDPHYWRNLTDAAGGDFLDSISKDVFGVSLCEPLDVQKKVQLEIATRNLINPLNVCENSCNTTYNNTAEQLGNMKSYLDLQERKSQASPNALTYCPDEEFLLGISTPDNPNDPSTYGTQMSELECFQLISNNYNRRRQQATSELTSCLQDCNRGSRKSSCTATAVWGNIRDIQDFSVEFQTYFKPEQNDIGQILTLFGLTQQAEEEAKIAEETIQNSKLGAVTSTLRTDILTPASLVEEKAAQPIRESSTIDTTQTGSLLADVGNIFANTLTQRLMERFFRSKCGLNPSACEGPGQTDSKLGSLLFSTRTPSGLAAARLQFASLARIDYTTGDPGRSQIAVSNQLEAQGIINSGFRQAIDEHMTVREALNAGLLNASATFGYDETDNEAENGIPYRSILYLRKYRVVPVGWELAAVYIGSDADRQSHGLGELVDLYDWCGQDAAHGLPNPDDPETPLPSPFCGLVDPSWVLKAPDTYCRRQGAGDEIIQRRYVCDTDTNGDGRINCSLSDLGGGDIGSWIISRNQDTCVDEPSCVAEDSDGNCLAYGYCYEEKPIWRFGGETCNGYYASCRSYTNSSGIQLAYLKDTLDEGDCNPENAGCRAYCSDGEYNAVNQTWSCRSDSGDTIYFDRDASSCPDGAVGCTELIRTEAGSNVLANAGFEYYTGTSDDGTRDTFGFCSNNGAACQTNGDCGLGASCEGWKTDNGAVQLQAVSDDVSGVGSPDTIAVQMSAGVGKLIHEADAYQDLSGMQMTFSYYAKALGASCSGTFGVQSADAIYVPAADEEGSAEYTDLWQQYAGVFTFPESAYTKSKVQAYINNPGCGILVDSAKLEFSAAQTVYSDYQTVNEISMQVPQTTLLSNGDFSLDDGTDFFSYPAPVDGDNSTADDNIPDGWTPRAVGSIAIDRTQGHFDDESLRIDASGVRSYAGQLVPVEQGKTYEVSGWVKSQLTPSGGDTPFGALMTECVYSASHPNAYETFNPSADEPSECLLSNFETYIRPSVEDGNNYYVTTGTSDWTYLRYTVTANNPDIGFMRVACTNVSQDTGGIQADGSGTVWCDDVKVVETPLSCDREEVGCQKYRPVGAGDAVNGVVRSSDICPLDQVGCRQFREMPIEHVPQRDGIDPVYIIESSGNQCTAASVGCEEYTNLDLGESGGEALAYFSQIKQCVKPTDPNAGNFYTWEGSEQAGYNLRAYKLLTSNVDQGPCTNLSVGTTTSDPICEDDSNPIAECSVDDLGVNPDCTEYFNDSGEVFYRLKSRTVTVSNDCHPFRNSIDAAAGEDSVYHVIPSEAVTCSAAAAGCRQYKGTTADSSRTVYNENFENGSVNGWSGGVTYSNESVNLGGHSMRTSDDTLFSIDLSNTITNGRTYSIQFSYKARQTGDLAFQIRDELGESFGSTVAIRPGEEWAQYELGPVFVNSTGDPTEFILEFTTPSSLPGGWIDNIKLRESVDSIYRIKGTTSSCDPANAGCRLYVDSANSPVAVTSFSHLCSDRAVGCEAMTVTQNSDYPFVQDVQDNPDKFIQGDLTLAYVNSSSAYCRAEYQGCTEYGVASYDQNNEVLAWSSTNLINDPDTYPVALCHPSQNRCEEYTESISGSKAYFRDPGNQTCEYRESAAYAGLLVDGWFITGTNEPCPSQSLTCFGGTLAGEPCMTSDQQQACLNNNGYCIAYPLDGEVKEVNLICGSTCSTGGSVGQACVNNGQCSNVCVGGTNAGASCLRNDDCGGGGTCEIGQCGDGGVRPFCDGRQTGSTRQDQENCLADDGLCTAIPQVGQPGRTCQGGPNDGLSCANDAYCSSVCAGGTNADNACFNDSDCPGSTCGVEASCANYWVGTCEPAAAGCTEFRDPLDPPQQGAYPNGCQVNCTLATDRNDNLIEVDAECRPGSTAASQPGCQPYYILRQSITSQVSECNSTIDFTTGCQPFYDTANPNANFIGG